MVAARSVRQKRFVFAGAGALLLFSIALRIGMALPTAFDGLYGQDPFAYLDYAKSIRALLLNGQPLGILYYPLGYPILGSLSMMLFGVQPLGPQLVSLAAGSLTAVVGGLLALELGRARGWAPPACELAGLITGLVLALCPQLIQSSIVVMSDAAGMFWATGSAWALAVYARTRRPSWLALAAIMFGWASMTRWQYALLAVPWILTVLRSWQGQIRWRHAAAAAVLGLLSIAPQIIYSLQAPQALVTNQITWSPAHFVQHDFSTGDGLTHYEQLMPVYYLLPLTSVFYTAPLILPFMGAGLLARRRSGARLIPGWIAVQYLYLSGIPVQDFRYPLAFYSPCAVLAGLGVVQVLHAVRALRWKWLRFVLTALAALAIVQGLASTTGTANWLAANFIGNKERDMEVVRQVEALIPEAGATVYSLDMNLFLAHYTSLRTVQVYYETPESMAARLPADRPAYALVNEQITETQWKGRAPWLVFHWLADDPGLTELGQLGEYTLFRVNP